MGPSCVCIDLYLTLVFLFMYSKSKYHVWLLISLPTFPSLHCCISHQAATPFLIHFSLFKFNAVLLKPALYLLMLLKLLRSWKENKIILPSLSALQSPSSSVALSKVQRGAATTSRPQLASSPGCTSRCAPKTHSRGRREGLSMI